MSNIVNKVKEVLHSDSSSKHAGSAPEGTYGPHSSRAANAADPRVDSDRDNTHHAGHARTAGHNEFGSGATTGTGAGYGGATEGSHGPHNSRAANVVDPRVDSDRDGSRTMGAGHTGGVAAGTGAYQQGYSTSQRDAYGPGSGATGFTGAGGAPEGTHGPHGSRVANATDPRVDSDRDGRAAFAGSGPGPAPHTAGPHKSDAMNKADPRVDSDLDGSKTVGGNRTYQAESGSARDPTDAAQVPPSVLRKHLGEPSLEHGDVSHDRARRNSVKTHQEEFRGV